MLIIGITVSLTYIILVAFQATQNNTSKAYTAIGYVLSFMDNIVTNLPIIGFIFFGVIAIGALSWYQTKQKGKGGGAA
jgi:uncharacterized protein YggT (Ycf19 family)